VHGPRAPTTNRSATAVQEAPRLLDQVLALVAPSCEPAFTVDVAGNAIGTVHGLEYGLEPRRGRLVVW